MTDPRDMGSPGIKEWIEFQATMASFGLLFQLLRDLDDVAPGYFEDLRLRIEDGLANSYMLSEEEPDSDGAVAIEAASRSETTWFDRAAAEQLHYRLFPLLNSTEGDFQYWAWSAVVIGCHSALEHYAIARGGPLGRRSLPIAVRDFVKVLAPPRAFPADLADRLAEFDEARHVLIHHRGAVSERYINNVGRNRLQRGELLPLNRRVVATFVDTTWQTADLLR